MAGCELSAWYYLQVHGSSSQFYSISVNLTDIFEQLSSLDDVKSSAQNDNNAFRSLALDHLGIIAGCLRTKVLKLGGVTNTDNENLKALDEVSIIRTVP